VEAIRVIMFMEINLRFLEGFDILLEAHVAARIRFAWSPSYPRKAAKSTLTQYRQLALAVACTQHIGVSSTANTPRLEFGSLLHLCRLLSSSCAVTT
jgi:hypothetical protein